MNMSNSKDSKEYSEWVANVWKENAKRNLTQQAKGDTKQMLWRELETDPPSGNEYAIILFPCKTDCGLLYIISNPHYAIKHGVNNGYTHWTEFQLAPDHDKLVSWQNGLDGE